MAQPLHIAFFLRRVKFVNGGLKGVLIALLFAQPEDNATEPFVEFIGRLDERGIVGATRKLVQIVLKVLDPVNIPLILQILRAALHGRQLLALGGLQLLPELRLGLRPLWHALELALRVAVRSGLQKLAKGFLRLLDCRHLGQALLYLPAHRSFAVRHVLQLALSRGPVFILDGLQRHVVELSPLACLPYLLEIVLGGRAERGIREIQVSDRLKLFASPFIITALERLFALVKMLFLRFALLFDLADFAARVLRVRAMQLFELTPGLLGLVELVVFPELSGFLVELFFFFRRALWACRNENNHEYDNHQRAQPSQHFASLEDRQHLRRYERPFLGALDCLLWRGWAGGKEILGLLACGVAPGCLCPNRRSGGGGAADRGRFSWDRDTIARRGALRSSRKLGIRRRSSGLRSDDHGCGKHLRTAFGRSCASIRSIRTVPICRGRRAGNRFGGAGRGFDSLSRVR